MVGSDTSLWGGLVAAGALFLMNFILKKLMFRFKGLNNLLQQKPEILIHNGKLEFKTLAKLGITSEELTEAMHEHGVEFFKDVKLAMLEIDGNISIISGNENLRQSHYKRRRNHKSLGGID